MRILKLRKENPAPQDHSSNKISEILQFVIRSIWEITRSPITDELIMNPVSLITQSDLLFFVLIIH